ncbi:MAG: membrane dipeptidase [Planctomycetales bacterium]|nr:membrane dipeptidase [Planctomycetales bacterium]
MNHIRTSRRQFLTRSIAGSAAAWLAGRGGSGFSNQLPATNNAIDQARTAALGVLKPSNKDLEHGLALHKASLVFDVYGFSPNAAVDGDILAGAIKAGASDIEVQDLTEDQRMTRHVTDATELAEYLAAWEASGVTCVFQNAGEEGSDPLRLLKRLARFTYVTDHLRETVFKAVGPDDIEAAKKSNRRCLYLTGNGVPLAGDLFSVTDELRYIRTFFELGIRMMHVTYNRRNLLGDGCAEPANGGLSDLGRAAIAEMNRVGVIVDVAHSGWRTSLEAAMASSKPIVASHTACDAVRHHIRNKPDEVIKTIVDGGGLVGVCCIPNFLGSGGDIVALVDHIDHVVQKFGIDHVAIGTDTGHRSSRDAAEVAKLPKRDPRRTRYEALWPAGSLDGNYPNAKSLAWTNWPYFTVGLVQRGYKEDDIRKILGQNMLRVARTSLQSPRPIDAAPNKS